MALIFALSSISQPPTFQGNADKQLHALLYAGLSALVVRALAGGWNQRVSWTTAIATVIFACFYGISDEYHQSFVTNRQSDVRDVVADTVGATVAVAACAIWNLSIRSGRSARSV